MITIEFSKRIAKEAQKNVTIEDFLLWVNDQCEWYELTGERFEYAINLAKKYYKKFHADTIKIKCEKEEEHGQRYFFVYELIGRNTEGKQIVLTRGLSKGKVEVSKEVYEEIGYSNVFVSRQMVWVD